MKKLALFAVVAVAVLGLPSAAGSTLSWSDSTGTGFASAEDVQTAFGWTNPQLRQRAKDITFRYQVTSITVVQCNRGTADATSGFLEARRVDAVNAKYRMNGFVFTGYGASTFTYEMGPIGGPFTVVDELPLVGPGDPCPWGPGTVDDLNGDFWFGLWADYGDQEAILLP